MDTMISMIDVTKEYKRKCVVDHVNLHVSQKEIVGIVGLKDCGKSVVLKMLSNLTFPSSGHIIIGGNEEFVHMHYPVGSLIEEPSIIGESSVLDNIYYQCALMNVKNPAKHAKNLIKMFQLKDVQKTPAARISIDHKWRLGIALALVGYPPVVLLDDPFCELSPKSVNLVTRILQEYRRKKQSTILITSRKVGPLQGLVDRLYMMENGKILEEISGQEVEDMTFSRICLHVNPIEQAFTLLHPFNPMIVNGTIQLPYKDDDALLYYNRLLFEHNVNVLEITIEQEDIDLTFPMLLEYKQSTDVPALPERKEETEFGEVEVIDSSLLSVEPTVDDSANASSPDTYSDDPDTSDQDILSNFDRYDRPDLDADADHEYAKPRVNEENEDFESIGTKGITLSNLPSVKLPNIHVPKPDIVKITLPKVNLPKVGFSRDILSKIKKPTMASFHGRFDKKKEDTDDTEDLS